MLDYYIGWMFGGIWKYIENFCIIWFVLIGVVFYVFGFVGLLFVNIIEMILCEDSKILLLIGNKLW